MPPSPHIYTAHDMSNEITNVILRHLINLMSLTVAFAEISD